MGNQAMTTSEALHFLETLDFEGEDANKFYKYMLRLGDIREITDAFRSIVLTPDPHTGLVPCGCGNTPVLCSSLDDKDRGFYWVECRNPQCHASAGYAGGLFCQTAKHAKKVWNTSRGYMEDV